MQEKIKHLNFQSNSVFAAITNNSDDYAYMRDLVNDTYIISDNLAKDFNGDIQGVNFNDFWKPFIHEHDIERVFNAINSAIDKKLKNIKIEYQVIDSSGSEIWIKECSTIIFDEYTNDAIMLVGSLHNLVRDGRVDTVTGLSMYNKSGTLLEAVINKKTNSLVSVILLGIDGFSSINTLNDHLFGDLVLRETAQELVSLLPNDFLLFRYDGDQFLIVAENVSKSDLITFYDKVRFHFNSPHQLGNKSYRFTISSGIASYPKDGNNWMELEKSVSIALKKAKEKGKNQCIIFTEAMLNEKLYEQSLVKAFSDDVDHNFRGFHVVFQPVCQASNLKIKGAEILIRYTTVDGITMQPDQFIPLLEQTQLIEPVGMWIIEQAIKICKKWTAYIKDFVMNINVSYLQLRDSGFCDLVEKLLTEYDLDVSHVTFELTESCFITDAPNIDISMKRLHELQLQVAMDDFGTGYSSLARLAQFNVDVVKIDRSFIMTLHKSAYNHDFVDSVIRLCHNVGMKVCVEGVETAAQQESVCLLNADYVQGFYISKPITEELFFKTYIKDPNANNHLVVVPNDQLRRNQIIGDRDVLLALMETTPLGMCFWNRDMEIIACNSETLHLFEVDSFEEFKNRFFEFSSEFQSDGCNSVDKAKDLIHRTFSGEKIKTFWKHRTSTGQDISTEVTFARLKYLDDYIVASYTRDMREQRMMEKKIESFNYRLKAILDATPLCLNLWNNKFENTMCNKAAVDLFDLQDEEEYINRFFELSPMFQPCGELSNDKACRYIEEAFKKGRVQFEWLHNKLNGEPIQSEITLVRIDSLDEDGHDLVAGYTRDMREEANSKRSQELNNNRMSAVLDSSPVACILWSMDYEIVDCNQVAVRMLDAKDKDDVKDNFDSFFPETQPNGDNSLLKKAQIFNKLSNLDKMVFEWVYIDSKQKEVPCEVTAVKLELEYESIYVVYSRDLREFYQTLELNDRLSKMAYYDLLTGVISRARLMEKMEAIFSDDKSDDYALLIFDVDYFKSVNDTYGHAAGDKVLKRVTKTISSVMPDRAIIGRLGGDEFVILLENVKHDELVTLMTDAVTSVEQLKFEFDNHFFSTSISVGAAFKSKEDRDCHSLLGRADKALYAAKMNGRNGFSVV